LFSVVEGWAFSRVRRITTISNSNGDPFEASKEEIDMVVEQLKAETGLFIVFGGMGLGSDAEDPPLRDGKDARSARQLVMDTPHLLLPKPALDITIETVDKLEDVQYSSECDLCCLSNRKAVPV
jgi:hypothetical protein